MNIKHSFFSANPQLGFLDEDESNHAIRVLRMQEGDFFYLLDGEGHQYTCKIIEANKKKLRFELMDKVFQEALVPAIHIAIALPKSQDRIQFFLEKVTEIGISEITPLLTTNSERTNIKPEKLEKQIIAAMKQSGQMYLPRLNSIEKFHHFVSNHTEIQKFIAHCEDDPSKSLLKNRLDVNNSCTILIGPEGDFTPEEVILAKEKGFKAISLGPSRLRTETAGIVACHTVRVLSY